MLMIAVGSCQNKSNTKEYKGLGDGLFAAINTTKGDIVIQLYYDATPVTVANFVSLAEGKNEQVTDSLKGKPYYEGVTFHRVIKDFMIQGGDRTGTGAGSPGYKFKNEYIDTLNFDVKGLIAMANSGPNTNGSQFFITHKETPSLNAGYTIFGKTVKGFEVVDSIANVEVNHAVHDQPTTPVIIENITIVRNGKAAKKFDAPEVMNEYFENLENVGKELLKNAEKDKKKATTLESGVKIYFTHKAENGTKPEMGSMVMVNATGYLEKDGSMFSTNVQEIADKYAQLDTKRAQMNGYKPMQMPYDNDPRLIAGFREALLQMNIGDKVRAFVPSHLGLGERGDGGRGMIPPNSDLIFDIEITGVAPTN